MSKKILDVCCGPKMFWFDKNNENAVFCDKRVVEKYEFYPNRFLEIKPDVQCDFTNLPFKDESFSLVVFDPPHLKQLGDTSWMMAKYGRLNENWEEELKKGFSECFRVLKKDGVLIFKWNETQIKVREILKLTENKALFGHKSGKLNKTHWITFMKG